MRRAGIDGDEAVLLGQGFVRRTIVVSLSGAGAVVDGDDYAGRCCEVPGHVDVEASVCGAYAADLGELAGRRGALAEGRG